MASVAGQSGSPRATVDSGGRLVAADSFILALQEEAGATLGDRLVLPQLAAIAELALQLGIPVARPAIVASKDADLDLWVHALPQDGRVHLTIENVSRKPASRSRLELASKSEDQLSSVDGEWSADEELRFTNIADDVAAIIGVSPGEAVGQPITKWIRLVEDEDGSLPLLVALAARSRFDGQHAMARLGTGGRLLLSGHPHFGENDDFRGFRGIARPEGINRPNAANEAGIAGIDPDLDDALRSPIVRIIAAAEGIASRSEGPLRNDYAVYAGDIASAARHLASVIRSMAEQPSGSSAIVDAVALANEAMGLVEKDARDKGIVVRLERPELISALGDDRSIVQILVNLLGNAVRHTPKDSNVILRIDKGTSFASWTVSDQGKGIAHEDHDRIFGRFERGAEDGGSAGLGLAIARRLAQSMGGDISLVSAPGQGAQFTLSLPLAP